ncbi:MAG: uroporphyrinogen decarboxylase family protein [Bacteroidota bacterium]
MTSRERLLTVLGGEIPDCVPVAPDFSNMIPARQTGKPFWDLYLYNDPPIWEAYIDTAKYFDIDAVMDGYFQIRYPSDYDPDQPLWEKFIVLKNSDRIVVQESYLEFGKRIWKETVDVYYMADPPTEGIKPELVGLRAIPEKFVPVEGVREVDVGPTGLPRVMELMGDQGLVGIELISSRALTSVEAIYSYYDHPELHEKWAQQRVDQVERRFKDIMAMEPRPDFICVGGSGTLVFQTLDIFKQLAFPAVKRGIDLATAAGFPTHIHSCGPETALVKLMAEETSLTVIDPLEIPPMGDCILADLKRLYGAKIVLKGNLHTTDVMLSKDVNVVIDAARKAIDDAAEGGRFILSTGDQCGRDTPDENLKAMIETARTYGKY